MVESLVIARNPVLSAAPVIERTLLPGDWLDYAHEIRAMGGFWEASFKMSGELDILLDLLRKALGGHMGSYTKGGEPAWEGMISHMALSHKDFNISLNLDNMGNRVWVRYATSTSGDDVGATLQDYDPEANARIRGGTAAASRSTVYQDSWSQARFGIKDWPLDGGITTAAGANQRAQMYLAEHKMPSASPESINIGRRGSSKGLLTFKCIGYIRTLGWRVYNQTTLTGTEDSDAHINRILTAKTQFIQAWNLMPNTTQQDQVQDADRFALDLIFDAARAGDSSFNRWVVGVYENRTLQYKQAAAGGLDNVKYVIERGGETTKLKYQGQMLYPLALVRPDAWSRVEGLYPYEVQALDLRADLAATYIEAVNYSSSGGVENLEIKGGRNRLYDVQAVRSSMGSASLS